MRHLAPLALLACSLASSALAIEGEWKAERWSSGLLQLSLTYGRTHNFGTNYDPSSFEGLSPAEIGAATRTPVSFALEGEAGRVTFEGAFERGKGRGHFVFEPKLGYFDAVRALGVSDTRVHRQDPSATRDERLLTLTLLDVSTAYIRSMIAEGYREDLDTYLTMRIFDVDPDYIRAMRAQGFGDFSAEDLIAMRIHGVTPEFRDEMAQLGYRLTMDQLVAFRIHGVTRQWIEGLKEMGYDHVDADKLVSTRIFQVTPAFIRELRDAGYPHLSIDELISMRVQGVTPDSLAKRRAI